MPSVEDWKQKYAALQAKYDALAGYNEELVNYIKDFRRLSDKGPSIAEDDSADWDEYRHDAHARQIRFEGYGK